MPLSGNDEKIHKPRLNYPLAQEYGCHLLAQPPGPVLNLNPNPETEILLYKSCLCLGMTKKSISLCALIQQPLRLDKSNDEYPTASSPNPKIHKIR